MAQIRGSSTRKPYGKLIVFGIVNVAIYTALLAKQEVISDIFTRGGMYALLPIAAAFLVSFVHGNFTGNFWTLVGVEASKKTKERK